MCVCKQFSRTPTVGMRGTTDGTYQHDASAEGLVAEQARPSHEGHEDSAKVGELLRHSGSSMTASRGCDGGGWEGISAPLGLCCRLSVVVGNL